MYFRRPLFVALTLSLMVGLAACSTDDRRVLDTGGEIDADSDAGYLDVNQGPGPDVGPGPDAGPGVDTGAADIDLLPEADPDAGGDASVDADFDVDPDADPDADVDLDLDVDPDPQEAYPTVAGDVVITELMRHPTEVAEAGGQWLELYNQRDDRSFDLQGCALLNGDGSQLHLIAGELVIEAEGYVTIANGATPGFTPDYGAEGFLLDTGAGALRLSCDERMINRVTYDDGDSYHNQAGRSLQRDPQYLMRRDESAGYWCEARETDYNNGDLGSPGGANETCLTPDTDTSTAIAALRADLTAVPATLMNVLVTYTKETVGGDPAGFFVQAEVEGPALFVKIDPTTLDPVVRAGQILSFDVIIAANPSSPTEVTEISNLNIERNYFNPAYFVQNLTESADLVSAVDDYESELIRVRFTIDGNVSGAGAGFQQYPIITEGIDTSSNFRFRLPLAMSSLLGLEQTCVVETLAPSWRFNATVQVSAWAMDDVEVVSCPAPVLEQARAADAESVVLLFSRDIASSSIAADGSQFRIAGLTVSAAEVNDNVVTLTTSPQTARAEYTVSVAATVKDVYGGAVGSPTEANFIGFFIPAVVISEFMARSQSGEDDIGEYIELYNTTDQDYDLGGCELGKVGSMTPAVMPAGLMIEAGQYIVFANTLDGVGSVVPVGTLPFILVNGGDTLVLTCANGVMDELTYVRSQALLGVSFQKDVDNLGGVNAPMSENWCATPNDGTYEYLTAKHGTPGAVNLSCP